MAAGSTVGAAYRDEAGINLFIGGDLSETDLEDYRSSMPFINTQTSFSLKNALHEPLLYLQPH